MSLSTAFRLVLTGASNVFALVGSRIRPVIADPGDIRPALTYRIINDVKEISSSGASRDGTCMIQIAVWDNDYDNRDLVASTVNSVLHGFNAARDGYHLTIFEKQIDEDTDVPDLGDEFPIYGSLLLYLVIYNRVAGDSTGEAPYVPIEETPES